MKNTARPKLKQVSVIRAVMLLILISFAFLFLMLSVSVPLNKTVSGAVYASSGVPVQDAVVTATSGIGFGTATTDVYGRYSITSGLPSGNYNLTVFASGYVQVTVENVSVTVGVTTTENAYLNYSGGISGTITDASTDIGLPNVAVVATSSDGKYGGAGTTDIFGDYVIVTNLPRGTYNVTAILPKGHVSKTLGPISVTEGTITTGNDMALEGSGIISGTVTDNSGKPLANVNVTAVSTSMAFGTAETDTTGYYSITDGLANGTYTVIATYLGATSTPLTNVSVVEGQETSNINFTMIPSPITSGIITGRVTDSNSAPIANSLVTAEGQTLFSNQSAQPDSSGNYIISTGLPNDTYNVTASGPGYLPSSQTVTVTVGNLSQADFTLTEIPSDQSGTISGTITGGGTPLIPEYESPLIMLLLVTLAAVAIAKSSNRKVKPR